MIIKDPNSDRVNQEDDNLVYLHDLTSTVFDLANQKCQKVLKGRAFFQLCANTKITNEKVCLVSLRGILCILNNVCGVVKITNSYLMRLMFANFMTYVMIRRNAQFILRSTIQQHQKEMLEEMRAEMKRLNDPLENWVYRIIDEI